jgi:hypothetical protein
LRRIQAHLKIYEYAHDAFQSRDVKRRYVAGGATNEASTAVELIESIIDNHLR